MQISIFSTTARGALSLLTGLLLSVSAPSAAVADLQVDYATTVGDSPSAHGTNSFATDGDEAMWIARWQETGVDVIRVQLPQFFIEPANDNADPHTIAWEGFYFDTAIPLPPDFSKSITFANAFAAMKQAGVTVQINPVYLGPWLTANPVPGPYMDFPGEAFCTYPPNDLDEYEEYITAVLTYLVDTIGYPPERIMLDVINEPDLGCGADPVVPCFWDDWVMADVVAVVQRSHAAIQAVDSRIRMVGLAECCGASIVRDLMDNYNGADYLSGLTYHRYVSSDFGSGIAQGNALKPYGLPVYCNEYGSVSYFSDGVDGALWHAYALPLMWENQICPLQFPFSENPYSSDPYNSMGLMYDWTLGWARKPAYWVYANFYANFPGKELVSIGADAGLNVLAGRGALGGGAQLALWISNPTETAYTDTGFTVQNFPATDAEVLVFDNLAGTAPVDSMQVSGNPLAFSYSIPSKSSLTFAISPEAVGIPSLGARGVLGLLLALLLPAAVFLRRRATRLPPRAAGAAARVRRGPGFRPRG